MDTELRHQILRALARDRAFLKSSAQNINATDFPTVEERIVAEAALTFYSKYKDPVGNLLRSTTEDLVQARRNIGVETKEKLKELLGILYGTKMELVSIQALEDRVASLKRTSFYENAVEEILTAHDQNKLSPELLSGLVERANRELNPNRLAAVDYLSEDATEKRIERRRLYANKQFPRFMIPCLDDEICGIGRGHTGLILAPFSSGKGMTLLHIVRAYAMQGLNVLHITLEDPLELVESRMDSALTGIPMGKLEKLPNRTLAKFKEIVHQVRGRIRLIDGTDGGWTLTRIAQAIEQLRQEGFVTDALSVDYDEYIVPEKSYKGDGSRRLEFDEIYRRMNALAVKLDLIWWTAAQGTRESDGKMWVTGRDTADDIGKIRKVFLALGLGKDSAQKDVTCLWVCRHRFDKSRIGVKVKSNFADGLLYDPNEPEPL